jgi:signal transduction histidine kinase
MRRLFDSVRVRLTVAVSLLFAAAMTLASYGLVHQVQNALINDVRVRNDAVAQALAQMITSNTPSQWGSNAAVVSQLPDTYDREMLQQGLDESVVYVEGPGAAAVAQPPSIFDRLKRSLTGEATPLFGKSLPEQLSSEQYVVSTIDINTSSGPVTLGVVSSLSGVMSMVERVRSALLFAVPSLVSAMVILAWFMTGRALVPVSAITGRVKEITGSTLDQRVPEPDTEDEIGDLARTMNAMLERLEHASDSQKRFMSDASHELRSPVAAIRTQLETALLHPESADWSQVGRTVLTEDQRLGALVDNLLVLSRLEEGVRRSTTDVDIDEILHDLATRKYDVAVDWTGVLAGRVVGVRDEVASIVRNLVDNAVRHASSVVRVDLTTDGGVVRLRVQDDGPGVPADLREKIFERFSRLEEGRSRDAGGAGLGLALTRRIVESHGGQIRVDDAPGGGAVFVVELPAAEGEVDDG